MATGPIRTRLMLTGLMLTGMLLTGCGGASEGGGSDVGETIYNRSCFSCHAGGVGGAPIPGDAEAWAPRVAKGRDALVKSVRDGVPPGMPPMGLCTSCTDADLAAAVDYMLSQ